MKDDKVRDELIEMVFEVCGNPNGVSQHGQNLLYETALRAEKDAAQRQDGEAVCALCKGRRYLNNALLGRLPCSDCSTTPQPSSQGGEPIAYLFDDKFLRPDEIIQTAKKEALALYPASQPQPAVPESDWTPCKQWLPAVGERYLCLGHAGKQFICWFDGNSWKREPQGKKVFGVTHWMNLPEPPEDNQ